LNSGGHFKVGGLSFTNKVLLTVQVDLYSGASGSSTSSTERQVLAQLLAEYSDVFSRGDEDMGLTKVISHEIPLAAGTTPILARKRR